MKATTPPFEALYATASISSGGAPPNAATEAMLTIFPRPCAIIVRPASCVNWNSPVRLTSITFCQPSSG